MSHESYRDETLEDVLQRITKAVLPSSTARDNCITTTSWIQSIVHHQLPTLTTYDRAWSLLKEAVPDASESSPAKCTAEELQNCIRTVGASNLANEGKLECNVNPELVSACASLHQGVLSCVQDISSLLDILKRSADNLHTFHVLLFFLSMLKATESIAAHVVTGLNACLKSNDEEALLTTAETLLLRELVQEPQSALTTQPHTTTPSSSNLAESLGRIRRALKRSANATPPNKSVAPSCDVNVNHVNSATAAKSPHIVTAHVNSVGGKTSLETPSGRVSEDSRKPATAVSSSLGMSAQTLEHYVASRVPNNGIVDWSLFNQLAGGSSGPIPTVSDGCITPSVSTIASTDPALHSREALINKLCVQYDDGIPTTYDPSFLQLPPLAQLGAQRITATSSSSLPKSNAQTVSTSLATSSKHENRTPAGHDISPQTTQFSAGSHAPYDSAHPSFVFPSQSICFQPQIAQLPPSPYLFPQSAQKPFEQFNGGIPAGTPAPVFSFHPTRPFASHVPQITRSDAFDHKFQNHGVNNSRYFLPSTMLPPKTPTYPLRRCHSLDTMVNTIPQPSQKYLNSVFANPGPATLNSGFPPVQYTGSIQDERAYAGTQQPGCAACWAPGRFPTPQPFRLHT